MNTFPKEELIHSYCNSDCCNTGCFRHMDNKSELEYPFHIQDFAYYGCKERLPITEQEEVLIYDESGLIVGSTN